MSYIYDSLKNALGGKNFRSGVVINDWSPNEVRAIYIMRDFILIADYLKQPKIYPLDVHEVDLDLQNVSRRGNLNNLLKNRQLSCIEEIYVDSCFMQYKDVIDLEEYVKSAYGQVSRLRYYGYVRGINSKFIADAYSKAFLNGSMDFTCAKNIGGLSYNDLGNDGWYKKYNLRPQFYLLDGDRGKLHTYFSKCENVVGTSIKEKDKQIELLCNTKNIITMFKVDIDRLLDISLLIKFINHCAKCDSFVKKLSDYLRNNIWNTLTIKGLSKDLFQKSVALAKIHIGEKEKALLDIYKKVSAFDDSDTEFKPSDDLVIDGIFQLEKRLDCAIGDMLDKCTNKSELVYFLLAAKRNDEGLPEGKLVDALKKKNILACRVTPKGNLSGLLRYVYGLGGYKIQDFEEYIRKNKNGN